MHPNAAVISEGESRIRIAREDTVLDVCWYGFAGARCVRGGWDELQGWYAERFGPALPASVLVLDARGPVPAYFGYALIPQPSREAPTPAVSMASARAVEVRIGGRHHRINITSPPGIASVNECYITQRQIRIIPPVSRRR
jgi:hypothetical protein